MKNILILYVEERQVWHGNTDIHPRYDFHYF